MFGIGVYFSVFYCLCYVMDMSTKIEEQVSEERVPDLNEDEDIRMDEIGDEHWRDDYEEGDYKNKIHALRWDVSIKDK